MGVIELSGRAAVWSPELREHRAVLVVALLTVACPLLGGWRFNCEEL